MGWHRPSFMASLVNLGATAKPRLLPLAGLADTTKTGAPDRAALVATVFKKLQDAGLVPKGAQLTDKAAGWSGAAKDTWQARLGQLIGDGDGNGAPDLDLDKLVAAKVLQGNVTADRVEAALGGPAPKAQPAVKAAPTASADPSRFDQAAARPMAGAPAPDLGKDTPSFVADLPGRLAKDPGAARAVQSEAIARAMMLTGKGDVQQAREVLLGAGDALANAGKLDEAGKVYGELTRAPLASAKVNLAQAEFDRTGGMPAPGMVRVLNTGPGDGTEVKLLPSSFATTTGELGALKQSQLELRAKMAQALGRPADPRNPDDARAYFQAFANTHTNAQVASEYQGYLQCSFKHSGDGVEWTRAIPQDERGRRLGELLRGQVSDASGRAIIDCEGFSYLTEHILGGLKDAQGDARFNVLYATRQGHVITGVVAPGTGELFTVNNDKVAAPKPVKTEDDVVNVIGKELMGGDPGIFGVSATQSGSQPQGSTERYAPPKEGSFIYANGKALGTVTPAVADMYRRYSRAQGLNSEFYDGFVAWAVKQR
jgi:hypothetical protein